MRKGRKVHGRPIVPDAPRLTLRTAPRGGGVRDRMEGEPADALRTGLSMKRRITLLIHGFNVPEADGLNAFRAFRANLPARKSGDQFWMLWPGDLTENTVGSVLGYPRILDRIPDCAFKAFQHLLDEIEASHHDKVEVRIVAHSLGCRLAMEIVKLFIASRRVDLRLMALLAPAIPLYKVIRGGALDLTNFGGWRVHVFHSRNDEALGWVFRSGQRVESDGAASAVKDRGALGLTGLQHHRHALKNVFETDTGLAHGDYWTAAKIADQVAYNLPFTDIREVVARKVTPRLVDAGRGVPGRRGPTVVPG